MSMRVEGKAIVVTGVVGGTGRALAPGLAREGAGTGVPGVGRTAATTEAMVGTAPFPASTGSDYITGQVITADGGMVFV